MPAVANSGLRTQRQPLRRHLSNSPSICGTPPKSHATKEVALVVQELHSAT